MAVPRNRKSNSRKHTKRSHMAKDALQFNSCKNCHKPRIPHRACSHCGFYNGKQVFSKDEA